VTNSALNAMDDCVLRQCSHVAELDAGSFTLYCSLPRFVILTVKGVSALPLTPLLSWWVQ